jgi:hypothetical protein
VFNNPFCKKAKQATNSSHPLRTTRGTWAQTNTEKTYTFADHLTSVFQPHPSENPPEEEKEALTFQLEIPSQLEPPLGRFHRSEVQTVINNLKPKSSPGYDLITGKILQELPPAGIKYLTQILNAAMLTGYFPAQWKVAKIILHLKPGKPLTNLCPTGRQAFYPFYPKPTRSSLTPPPPNY